MTSDFSFIFDVWWRWLLWRSGEGGCGAGPREWRVFDAGAFDQRDKCVADFAQERGTTLGSCDAWPAGDSIRARVSDHVREDAAFRSIGVVDDSPGFDELGRDMKQQ